MVFHRDVIIFLLIVNVKGTYCESDHATNLSSVLFTGYDSAVLAKCGSSNLTKVRIDLALRQVIELDEPDQILKINLWIRLQWVDCRLTWNSEDYNNITNLIVPYNKIWIPDITLYDTVSTEFVGLKDFRPSINSDGTVYYNFPTILESLCPLDVTKFPYDTQTCKLMFGSWSYHGLDLDLVYKNPFVDLSSAQKNVEWEVKSFTAERHVVYYGCCPEPYPDVTFYLKVMRKPSFYVNNIIIPSFLITAIAILGFFLPVEAGEKVSLQMTVLLSLAVFQLLVADSLPPSDATPLIGTYFNFSLFLVGFACLAAVISLVIHYQGSRRRVPEKIRIIFLKWMSRILCVWDSQNYPYKTKNESKTDNKVKPDNVTELKTFKANGLTTMSEIDNTTEQVDNEAEKIDIPDQEVRTLSMEEEWETLSIIIDKLTCAIFGFILVIGTIAIFTKFES